MDGEVEVMCRAYQGVFPFAHLLATPAGNGIFIDGETFVGKYQVRVDADDAAEALAGGTSAVGVVEGEHVDRRRLEDDAVSLKAGGELSGALLAVDIGDYQAAFLAFVKSGLDRVGDAAELFAHLFVHFDAVDE